MLRFIIFTVLVDFCLTETDRCSYALSEVNCDPINRNVVKRENPGSFIEFEKVCLDDQSRASETVLENYHVVIWDYKTGKSRLVFPVPAVPASGGQIFVIYGKADNTVGSFWNMSDGKYQRESLISSRAVCSELEEEQIYDWLPGQQFSGSIALYKYADFGTKGQTRSYSADIENFQMSKLRDYLPLHCGPCPPDADFQRDITWNFEDQSVSRFRENLDRLNTWIVDESTYEAGILTPGKPNVRVTEIGDSCRFDSSWKLDEDLPDECYDADNSAEKRGSSSQKSSVKKFKPAVPISRFFKPKNSEKDEDPPTPPSKVVTPKTMPGTIIMLDVEDDDDISEAVKAQCEKEMIGLGLEGSCSAAIEDADGVCSQMPGNFATVEPADRSSIPAETADISESASSEVDIATWIGIRVKDIPLEILTSIIHEYPEPSLKDLHKSKIKSGGQSRSFRKEWLDLFPWLVYSKNISGGFCKFCALGFSKLKLKGGQPKLLISAPLSLKDGLKDCNTHQQSDLHKDALLEARNYFRLAEGKDVDVHQKQMKYSSKQEEETRLRIERGVTWFTKIAVFLGRQELSLRKSGDRVEMPLDVDLFELDSWNYGNFNAIILLLISSGNKDLADHLKDSPQNALYASPKIQNELIGLIGAEIQRQIVNDIKKSPFYSVIADTTIDAGGIDQLSLVFRYLKNDKVEERFLEYVDVSKSTTGVSLFAVMMSRFEYWKIDVSKMRGQGYDGASNMRGHLSGLQALFLEQEPKAIYVHCYAHTLNLALLDSAKTSKVEDMVGITKKLGEHFNRSAKRGATLRVTAAEASLKKNSLINPCLTRWGELGSALDNVFDLFEVVVETLDQISTEKRFDAETRSDARIHLKNVLSYDYVVSAITVQNVLRFTRQLSIALQKKALDITSAHSKVNIVTNQLKEMRANLDGDDGIFSSWWNKTKEILDKHGIEAKIPRITTRQKHRQNPNVQSPEDYFRITIAAPFLDRIISEMETRFGGNSKKLAAFSGLVPALVHKTTLDDLKEVLDFYKDDLPEFDRFETELAMWKADWGEQKQKPDTFIETLASCSGEIYPNIKVLLEIFISIPVTTATGERSFSNLKRIKTRLRSSMAEERLNGLTLLSIHKDINVDPERIVKRFFLKNPHRRRSSIKVCATRKTLVLEPDSPDIPSGTATKPDSEVPLVMDADDESKLSCSSSVVPFDQPSNARKETDLRSRFSWMPGFPVPDGFSRIPPTATSNRALVVDFWGGSPVPQNLVNWLTAIGIKVTTLLESGQVPNMCGYIVAEMITMLITSDARLDNVDLELLKKANQIGVISMNKKALGKRQNDNRWLTGSDVIQLVATLTESDINIVKSNVFDSNTAQFTDRLFRQHLRTYDNTGMIIHYVVNTAQGTGLHWFLVSVEYTESSTANNDDD